MAGSRRGRGRPRVREAHAGRYASHETASLTGVILDSDVIIEVLRGRADVIEGAHALETSATPSYCTPISVAEVYAGVRPGEEEVTRAFFEARGEVVLDAATGRRAGLYLARYAQSHGVEIADALIAAAATTSELRLWTLNRKHYPMDDIQFFEPAKSNTP
ncbi:MAG: PIN domain-containing protein [Gemmatimonadetes bacterium]|nr:PIN domain-containing protein [Gemmatimonadota bacterium]MCH7716332.1 PIN domain-containing protein [Gemmatimonadota bacterium]